MSTQIQDGGGSGRLAGVDEDRRLATSAVSTPSLAAVSADKESAFALPTGIIALTAAAGESGVLYHKNTSPKPQAIHRVHLGAFASARWRLYRSVTAGTLISAGTVVVPRNLNIGSPVGLAAEAKHGADGQTVTDGEVFDTILTEAGSKVLRFDGSLILAPSTAFAITCAPLADAEVTATLLVSTE